MNTLVITLGSIAIGTIIVEKICIAFGKADWATMVNVGGMTFAGIVVLGNITTLLNALKGLF